jgi:hypothetical protein
MMATPTVVGAITLIGPGKVDDTLSIVLYIHQCLRVIPYLSTARPVAIRPTPDAAFARLTK